MSDPGRIHSMDALRASSMLLLVPVHAAIFLKLNGSPGAWATVVFWVVHVFRLPLFFAMSGFFLALLLTRKGLATTARNRTLRIAIPHAVGVLPLAPLLRLAAQAAGVSFLADGSVREGNPFALEPSFLWFLWYLLIVDACAIAGFLWVPSLLRAGGSLLRSAVERPFIGVALLAIPTALTIWPEPTWVQETNAKTFVPELHALAYYAIFFAMGATLFAHRRLVDAVARDASRWAAMAIATAIPAGALFALHNSDRAASTPVHAAALLVYAIATWTSLLALVGLATRFLDRPRPALRYHADSSYWIYLSHMPAMALLVGFVGAGTLATGPRFLLITAASLAFSLATYPLFVRYTIIGRTLNGPRRRPQRRAPLSRPGAAAARRA
jgi:glucan biosynthesis protein C